MKRWHVVQTRFRGEHLALANLRRQGFEAYLPRYLKRRRHARRTQWLPAPLFPGYMFVRLDIEAMPWRPVLSTIGVRSLIRHGEVPTPLPPGIVEDIMAREDDAGLVVMNDGGDAFRGDAFRKGDAVEVMSGAFRDRVGLFDCADADKRVVILLDLLGRQTRVHIPVEAIRARA